MTRVIPLTVLVHEGPMARAYLGVLRASGLRVSRAVVMVNRRDPALRRTVAPWLPLALRRPWARIVQDQRMNYWPREIYRHHRRACERWLSDFASLHGVGPELMSDLTSRQNYAAYADHVDEVFVDGLADPSLREHLCQLADPHAVLFTGGGMVPAALLDAVPLRFIHVHPGVLPEVRGADGLLWSLLVRGQPGATAFYMNSGLDTGDIIQTGDMQCPALPQELAALDTQKIYRFIYSYVDPLLRAVFLRSILEEASNPMTLKSQPQAAGAGVTFHFMHERLRRIAMERLFVAGAAQGLPHG